KFPATVPVVSRRSAAVATAARGAAHGPAQLKVHYTPQVTAAPQQVRRAAPRPVVSIPKDHAAAAATAKIPTRLRHSMSEFLGHAAAHAPAAGGHSGSM